MQKIAFALHWAPERNGGPAALQSLASIKATVTCGHLDFLFEYLC
jgi:hypothetical protein